MVQTLGFPEEFESIVKSLWALRLSHFSDKLDAAGVQADVLFSSQTAAQPDLKKGDNAAAKWKAKTLPTLLETLALQYLVSTLLRMPLTIGELHGWAVTEVIPFVRAIRFVPSGLKKRMAAEYHNALDTLTPLGPDHLRRAIHHLALLYQHHFSLKLPSLNVPPLLFRYLKHLALPLEIFRATNGLAQILKIDFAFPQPSGRQYVSRLPEITLASLLVIATKLYHPFDDYPRSIHDPDDPAALAIDWDAWSKALNGHRGRLDIGDHLLPGTEIQVRSEDAMYLSSNQMDDYLDWYERTWVDETRAESAPRGASKQLLEMFPVSSDSKRSAYDARSEATREHESKMVELRETMLNLQGRRVMGSDAKSDAGDANPPVGALYKRYRRADELSPHARDFHNAMANLAAIELDTLLTAVLQLEGKILAWRKQQLRDEGKDDGVGEEGLKEPGTSSELEEGEDDEEGDD